MFTMAAIRQALSKGTLSLSPCPGWGRVGSWSSASYQLFSELSCLLS